MSRPPRVLAFVGAHPDDDVMGIAGVVALHRDDPGFRFVLVIATDGEAGEIAPGSDATRETLGAVRRAEDEAGWAVVGRAPDRVEWFGLPDGALAELPAGHLEDRIFAVLQEERPDVVVTFGADGITGHPDHITVRAATDAAFDRCRAEPGPGLQRLIHGAFPQSHYHRLNEGRQRRGEEPFDPTRVYHPRAVPDDAIAFSVDQSDVWERVRDAMRAHRSQWTSPWADLDDRQWRAEARARHYVQAWPPRNVDDPLRVDLFQDLDPAHPAGLG